MITDIELEKMCKLYCTAYDLDPDEMIATTTQEEDLLGELVTTTSYVPRWTTLRNYFKEQLIVNSIILEVLEGDEEVRH